MIREFVIVFDLDVAIFMAQDSTVFNVSLQDCLC